MIRGRDTAGAAQCLTAFSRSEPATETQLQPSSRARLLLTGGRVASQS